MKMAKDKENLKKMRHSLAHILAHAVQDIYEDVKFGVGPVIDDGFYYDFDLEQTISEDDLTKIEKRMREIIKDDLPFTREDIDINSAKERTKKAGQTYKTGLVDDLATKGSTDTGAEKATKGLETVSFYTIGNFTDLCRGGHLESTGKVGAFKLTRVSGAYWRGDEKNPQMQRIYGVAFETEDELDKYLTMLEEAKKRDHRKIGKELDLFTFSDLVGAGLPLWTPRGTVIRNELDKYVQDLRDNIGFLPVVVPHITKKDLYEKSGHWSKFADELFHIKTREGHEFVMKPMNCPHHTQIYASRTRSYRDLPIRYRETTMCYRDEQTGELGGLSRVRSFTQDDAHIFCREDQIESEVLSLWRAVQDFYGTLDFPLSLRFSRRDPKNKDAYAGSQQKWDKAEEELRKVVAKQKDMDIDDEGVGEAAFYGPKLDFMAKDSLGRQWQVATIQLDFAQPEGLDLKYVDSDGSEKRPVMIHCAVMGSIERFLSVYIEHTAGKFPVWLSPEQIRVITVNQEFGTTSFAEEIANKAKSLRLRLSVDNSNESVGKKIRNAEVMKIPYTIVIGEKEIKSGRVVPRVRQDLVVVAAHPELPVDNFLKSVANETKNRVNKSSM